MTLAIIIMMAAATAAGGNPDELPATLVISPPVFSVATGSYFLNITAPAYQAGVTKLEVLLPPRGVAAQTSAVVLALPVEAGGTFTQKYGSAIGLIRAAAWHSRHNIAVVTPSFSRTPWFGDRGGNSTKPPVRQEAFVIDVILPWIRSQQGGAGGGAFGKGEPSLGGNISLVGFSKSGWGAFSLFARNPQLFARVAVWDAPMMLGTAFCHWLVADGHDDAVGIPRRGGGNAVGGNDLWGMMEVFGDCTTWDRYSPVELLRSILPAAGALSGRLWLGGQHYFGNLPLSSQLPEHGSEPAPGAPFNHTVDFHALLLSRGVRHEYNDSCDPGRHEWSWVWLQPALNSLL